MRNRKKKAAPASNGAKSMVTILVQVAEKDTVMSGYSEVLKNNRQKIAERFIKDGFEAMRNGRVMVPMRLKDYNTMRRLVSVIHGTPEMGVDILLAGAGSYLTDSALVTESVESDILPGDAEHGYPKEAVEAVRRRLPEVRKIMRDISLVDVGIYGALMDMALQF